VPHPALIPADVTALPLRDSAFDIVLAAHLLDLVPDRRTAIRELRRVLAPGGTCVAVTNGAQHLRSLRDLIEQAARSDRLQPDGGTAVVQPVHAPRAHSVQLGSPGSRALRPAHHGLLTAPAP